MIHPPHLTLYAIVAATACGASLVFLVFVTLYSIARALVPLMRWARGRGEGRRDLQPEKAHRLTTAATSGSISGSSLDQGEIVTIPSLPDKAEWDAFETARRAMSGRLSSVVPARRYNIRHPQSAACQRCAETK
jgi:hypothetical protein